jgi:hypothetical protein
MIGLDAVRMVMNELSNIDLLVVVDASCNEPFDRTHKLREKKLEDRETPNEFVCKRDDRRRNVTNDIEGEQNENDIPWGGGEEQHPMAQLDDCTTFPWGLLIDDDDPRTNSSEC